MFPAGRTLRLVVAVPVAIALSACQTIPPNTPGAGSGKTYTPIVDMQGVSHQQYLADLDSCRSSAAMVNAEREALAGFIAGALIGAAIGAAYGGNSRTIDSSAAYGAGAGMGTAGGRAIGKQERIMGNCLAGRGYRVLDGSANVTFVVPSVATAAVPTVAVAPAVTTTLATPAPAAPAAVLPTPAVLPHAPAAPPAGLLATAPPPPSGEDAFNAERLGRELRCADANIRATLVGKGPGYESYSMKCSNGETLLIRCEWGNCRALR
jgi:hypothetical protein